MLTCSSHVRHFPLRLLFIFVSALIIQCESNNKLLEKQEDCPFIETLSFGSDFDIKCNSSYFIFNEVNEINSNWKFANPSSFCQQKGRYQAFVNQCNITRIGSKYLKVPVRSLDHNEHACIYCPINYIPIAPMIVVTQSNDGYSTSYTFNLTATGLAADEAFEILWAKRSSHIHHSFNYWFLHGCIDHFVDILEDTGHRIIFLVDDVPIDRIEFIIRRCHGMCRPYRTCNNEEFVHELSSNHFHIPDSIEKISCNSDCLNGLESSTTTTTTTMKNIIKEDILVSTIEVTSEKQTIKFHILFLLLGLLLVLILIMLVFLIICRMKNLRSENVYMKASHINLDENK